MEQNRQISQSEINEIWRDFYNEYFVKFRGIACDTNGFYLIGSVDHQENSSKDIPKFYRSIPVAVISWKAAKSKLDIGNGRFHLFIDGFEIISGGPLRNIASSEM